MFALRGCTLRLAISHGAIEPARAGHFVVPRVNPGYEIGQSGGNKPVLDGVDINESRGVL
jgi:hypothetical protein